MSRNRMKPSTMTPSELVARVETMPGGWYVRLVMGENIRLRYVAQRAAEQRDAKTGERSDAQQFESAVDAEDLIERISRRNRALGLTKERTA